MAKKKYYAIKKGHEIGIFQDWTTCFKQIHGFKGSIYKGFETLEEAENYMDNQIAIQSERYETEEEVFSKLKEGEMIAYVDGSNLGDGSAFSYASVIFYKKNGEEIKTSLSGKNSNDTFLSYRNVAGELFASVKTVDFAIKLGLKKISMYHDYSGIRHWALAEWKTRNDLSKYYRRYMEKSLKEINVEFVKTDGHTGDKFNEEVDKLAKSILGIKK